MQHILRTETVRMACVPLHVIVGLHAEGIGFAVSVQEADFLRNAERNPQNGIGDVRFAGAADLHLALFALQDRCARKLHATHPCLSGIEHRIEKLKRELVGLASHQLIELNGLAHHRIVEKGDAYRFLQALEHGYRLPGKRILAFLGHVETQGKLGRQVCHCKQHADRSQGVEQDFTAPLPHHGGKVCAQRVATPGAKHEAGYGQGCGPCETFEENCMDGAGRRQQRNARNEDQAGSEKVVHVSAATADSWCSGSARWR